MIEDAAGPDFSLEPWDEVRTAFYVARIGTVSGAAQRLGVHHATVIRHVDALEARLGVALFHRHPRGYTPTEAGEDLLSVAAHTEEQFAALAGRLRGRRAAVSGELVVTTVDGFGPLLLPVVAAVQAEHPELRVSLIADARLFRLEYGEAHVALRAGAEPREPDNVVQRLCDFPVGLYASRAYAEAHGLPETAADLARHRLISTPERAPRAPFRAWLAANAPDSAFVLRASEPGCLAQAVEDGMGIGFMAGWRAAGRDDLVAVLPEVAVFPTPLWLVTHTDLHRTAKVQAMTGALKEAARHWPTRAARQPGLGA